MLTGMNMKHSLFCTLNVSETVKTRTNHLSMTHQKSFPSFSQAQRGSTHHRSFQVSDAAKDTDEINFGRQGEFLLHPPHAICLRLGHQRWLHSYQRH